MKNQNQKSQEDDLQKDKQVKLSIHHHKYFIFQVFLIQLLIMVRKASLQQ